MTKEKYRFAKYEPPRMFDYQGALESAGESFKENRRAFAESPLPRLARDTKLPSPVNAEPPLGRVTKRPVDY